ncbi:MAG TPA: hypothetical protein DEP00_02750 [Lachnospiraceae bacterium]|nr:hypothetical protein [Lachnospiraceae bacterium]
MDPIGVVFTVVAAIALVVVIMYFVGKRLMKKQNESMAVIDANRQFISGALIIDKKKAKIAEANFPKAALEQMPKRMRWMKVPLVKVKVGPQITTLLCDQKVFEAIPVKKIVRLEVSGGYILGFSTQKKGEKKPEFEKKLTWREKMARKASDLQARANAKEAK